MNPSVFAQAPEKMSYQAVIRDAGNELVVNAEVGMRLSIMQGSADGVAHQESVSKKTMVSGGQKHTVQ